MLYRPVQTEEVPKHTPVVQAKVLCRVGPVVQRRWRRLQFRTSPPDGPFVSVLAPSGRKGRQDHPQRWLLHLVMLRGIETDLGPVPEPHVKGKRKVSGVRGATDLDMRRPHPRDCALPHGDYHSRLRRQRSQGKGALRRSLSQGHRYPGGSVSEGIKWTGRRFPPLGTHNLTLRRHARRRELCRRLGQVPQDGRRQLLCR